MRSRAIAKQSEERKLLYTHGRTWSRELTHVLSLLLHARAQEGGKEGPRRGG